MLGKTWFSNFLAHEILFGFQISYGGFDIFSGRTLLNWQARFFDHFFIPRAHEFSNGIRSVGKVRIKGVWKKNHPMDHNFKPKIEIPIFITYFHKRKKQDRHHSVSKSQKISPPVKIFFANIWIFALKTVQIAIDTLEFFAQKLIKKN